MAFLSFTAATLLYVASPAQAQMQSLTYPDASIAPQNNKAEKPKLYNNQNDKPEESAPAPELQASADMDEESRQEMDRVYQMYKELSEKQRAKAEEKPIKTQTADTSGGAAQESSGQPAIKTRQNNNVGGGIGSILQEYQKEKNGGVKTRSMQISDPEKYKSTNPR